MNNTTLDPDNIEHLDLQQVFLLFANFGGDVIRTAAALSISPAAVLRMADEDGWLARIEPLIKLSKSGRPGDHERGINRAICFVQAHRFRLILERTIKRLTSLTDAELEQFMSEVRLNKEGAVMGSKLNLRALSDMAAALEKAHHMTYAALNDSMPERAKRKQPDEDGDSTTDIHAKLAAAMSSAGLSRSPRAILFEAQVQQGEAIAERAAKQANAVPNPNDNDDH